MAAAVAAAPRAVPVVLPGRAGRSAAGHPGISRQPRIELVAASLAVVSWQLHRHGGRRKAIRRAAVALSVSARKTGLRTLQTARRAAPASTSAVKENEDSDDELEDEDEEEDVYYPRAATPRERQFGIYDGPSRSSSSRRREAVSVPLSQLHTVAAQRMLPGLSEALPEGMDTSDAIMAWSELLEACQAQAPELLATWNCGVGPLMRLAMTVPKDRWLRDPREIWCADPPAVEVDVHEAKEGPTTGFEYLPKLEKLLRHLLARYDDAPMALAGGFTWSDGAGGVLRERLGREVVLCSPSGLQLCARFIKLFTAIGAGEKPAIAARELLTPGLTKKTIGQLMSATGSLPPPPPIELPSTSRSVQPLSVTLESPLTTLRRAQVAALGGPSRLVDALAQTRLGKDLGTEEEEAFAESVLSWACRFSEEPELLEPKTASASMEWLLSQHQMDPAFSLVLGGNPRAPKKVLAAARRDAATLELQRLQTSGQRFLPNPAGVKGFIKKGVMAAFGTTEPAPAEEGKLPQLAKMLKNMGVADDEMASFSQMFSGQNRSFIEEPPNSWQGDEYEPSQEEEEFLRDPKVLRRATVKIEEILSFEYLQYVGQTMKNCLRVERRGGSSLMKYMSRVKARDSSFWVMTITAEAEDEDAEGEADVQHLLLMEVYNGLKVIHQAEGPHPRRWPRVDAWGWLQEWAAQEGLTPDGPEGVTVGPYGGYDGSMDPWDIRRCFLW